jgi:hypothetical protein
VGRLRITPAARLGHVHRKGSKRHKAILCHGASDANPVGQPILAVLHCLHRATPDSQEWLLHRVASAADFLFLLET